MSSHHSSPVAFSPPEGQGEFVRTPFRSAHPTTQASPSRSRDTAQTPSPRQTSFVRTLSGSRDHATYGHFLLSLDAETRRSRFCGHLSDQSLLAHVARQAAGSAILLGAFEDGQLVGVAELVPLAERGTAEAAFVVSPEYQGKGIGSALMERAALAATNRGLHHIRVFCLPHNQAMQRLAAKAHGNILLTVDEVEGRIETRRASIWTLWREHLGDSAARWAEWARGIPKHLKQQGAGE